MTINNWFKKKTPEPIAEKRSFFDSLMYNSQSGYTTNKAMYLSTVYRCVEVISDSVAQLPLEPYLIDDSGYKSKHIKHPTYRLLNKEPNNKMSRFTFIKTLIQSVLLRGNGYAYIERDKNGNVLSLQFIDSTWVTIVTTDTKTNKLMYSITGFDTLVEPINMIHILNFSYDGIRGVSTLEHAKLTLGLATDSEAHAAGFFKGGANLAGYLKMQTQVSPAQAQALKSSWQQSFNAVSGMPNGIAVVEGNAEFVPVSVNPADAQLLETREFNVIDICRFFGVSPVKAFDLSKSSYSTVEATQLAFLTDTLSPLLEKIELEFERKLYKPSERDSIDVRFDTSVLLRADKASQAEYFNKLFQIGAITINEIRKELDLPAIDNGDNSFVQVNVSTLNNAIKEKINDGITKQ